MKYSTLLAAVIISLATALPAGATQFGAQGPSKGNRDFRSECDGGRYMVGLSGGIGEWIDSVQVICAKWNPAKGRFGKHHYGKSAGGKGGTQVEFYCSQNEAVLALRPYQAIMDNKQIGMVRMDCSPPQIGGSRQIQFGNAGYEQPHLKLQKCPQGEFATGVHGRSGKTINAIGLICEPFVAAEPEQVSAPASAPAKETLGFTGSWNTVSSGGGTYVLTIEVRNGDVTGTFTNAQDPRFDGRIRGTMDSNGKEFTYTYTQNNGGQGSGIFKLSGDGMGIRGTVGSAGQMNSWNGTRM